MLRHRHIMLRLQNEDIKLKRVGYGGKWERTDLTETKNER